MSKRIFQVAVALVAMTFLVLAPIACQQAEKAADTTETAKPAGNTSGKKLMAAKPNAEKAVEAAGDAIDEGTDAVGDVIDDGADAVGDVIDDGVEAVGEGVDAVADEAGVH